MNTKVKTEKIKKYINIIFPVLFFSFLLFFGKNLILRDDWDIANQFYKFSTGKMEFMELFKSHNEAIYFFPRLIMLFLLKLSDYDMRILLIMNFILYLAIYSILNIKFNLNFIQKIIMCILFFNLKQYENLIWGFQLGFLFSILFCILCLYFFDDYINNKKRRSFYLTIIFLLLTVFCNALGLILNMTLFIMMLFLLIQHKKYFKDFILIILFFSLSVFIYKYFVFSFSGMKILEYRNNIIDILKFFILLNGNHAFWAENIFFYVPGLINIFLSLYFIYKFFKTKNQCVFSNSLLLMLNISLFSLALSRYSNGLQNAIISRYSIFSILITLVLFIISQSSNRFKIYYKQYIIFLILFLYPVIFCRVIEYNLENNKYLQEEKNRQLNMNYIDAEKDKTNILKFFKEKNLYIFKKGN